MQFSDDIKDRILESIDIVDIISEVVELRRRGSNYVGLCPFHTEKTPSFAVSPDKNIYKCFGCGKSGNVISFMMDYHGLSYPDTVKELARRSGIALDETKSERKKEELSRKDKALLALEYACKFYEKKLNLNQGKAALAYFLKRGFSSQTIKDFSLGYSPDSWDELLNELQKQKFTVETLADAGLIIKNEARNSYYDRFRNRAMYPIHNFMGKVIGFGARQLSDDKNQPKYINSPQTVVYDKSSTLYGIFFAKNEIRAKKSAILVEGYMDAITCHQSNIKNVIASSGTSLTKEQLNILKKLCSTLYFVYDADSAGVNATQRGLEMALEKGFDVIIVSLPSGEDPDSLIKNHGSAVFQTYLNEGQTFLDFLIEKLNLEGKFATPALKAESIRFLLGLITKIPDRLQHDEYIAKIGSSLNLSENQLKKIYNEKLKIEKNNAGEDQSSVAVPPAQKIAIANNVTEPIKDQELNNNVILREEQEILKLAVTNDKAFYIIFKGYKLTEDRFISDKAKEYFRELLTFAELDDGYIQAIFNSDSVSPAARDYFAGLALSGLEKSTNWSKFVTVPDIPNYQKMIKDLVFKLQLIKLDASLDELKQKLKLHLSPDEQKLVMNTLKTVLEHRKQLVLKMKEVKPINEQNKK